MYKNYSKKDIERINEIFHDQEAKYYDSRHLEIIDKRSENWQKIFSYSMDKLKKRHIKILDYGIGTGIITGFVIKRLGIKRVEKVVGIDISQAMLQAAVKRLSFIKNRLELIKITPGEKIDLDHKFDLIIINSVLHHLPEPESKLNELAKILEKNGILLVVHEPNVKYSKNFVLRNLFLLSWKIKNMFFKSRDEDLDIITENTNKILLKEKIIEKFISKEDLQSVVDLHVPDTFGKLKQGVGINPYMLAKGFSKEFQIIHIETYRYFSKGKSIVLNIVDNIFKLFFPKSGRLFYLVIRKR